MANEKSPLLKEYIIKIPADKQEIIDDENNNLITRTLTYEELMPYIIDPCWNKIRAFCFLAYWMAFLVCLIAAVVFAVLSMSSCNNVSSLSTINSSSLDYLNNNTLVGFSNQNPSLLSVVMKIDN
ncbi:unnamed protein product [Diamesa hyperborea]